MSIVKKFRNVCARHAWPALPLALGAAGAALIRPLYFVGYFNDDAAYALLAGGLWAHLKNFSLAGAGEAFSHFLPGYPLFLAPFSALAAPRWDLLNWTSVALFLAGGYALWLLLEGLFEEEERRWTLLLYAVHPLALCGAGMVMADVLLTALFLGGLLALRRAVETCSARWTALLLFCSVWAAAVKPIGALLPAALTAGLAAARSRRPLAAMGVFFWLPALAGGLWLAAHGRSLTDYTDQLAGGLASLAAVPAWERGYDLLYHFVLLFGLGLPWPRGPLADALGFVLAALVLAVCGLGLRRLLKTGGAGRCAALAAALLLGGQLLVLALWTVYSERYALPMLPLAAPALVAGVYACARGRRVAAAAVLCVLAGLFGIHSAHLALRGNSGTREKLFTRTLEWIRTETAPSDRFVGRAPIISLYTGREATGVPAAPSMDAYLSGLTVSGVTYVLQTRFTVLSTKGTYKYDHAMQMALESGWVRGHPGLFKKVFADADEGTEIFKLTLPAGWTQALPAYGRALQFLRLGSAAPAERELRLALKFYPEFPSALAALAGLRAGRAGGAAEAETLLRRALRAEPNFPRARRALVALLQSQNRPAEAGLAAAAGEAANAAPLFEI